MDYTITPSSNGKYIILKVKGTFRRPNIVPVILEAHALGMKLHIRGYLSDMTEAKNVDTNIENYEFAYTDMRKTEGIDKFARIATLVRPDDHSHDFVETVGVNTGMNFKIFTDRDEAVKFVMEEENPKQTPEVDS